MALNRETSKTFRWDLLALVISLAALVLALMIPLRRVKTVTSASESLSTLEKIKKTGVLRAGYSGFKPYTIINPGASPESRITGYCADMINEIARRQNPPWKVEWHQVTFETLRADMESGRFDVFADAVYQTAPRASEFGFTIPYSYFGVAVAVVRKGDKRFGAFSDLDRPNVTIALAEGWTSTEYARQRLSKPVLKSIPVADDPFIPLQEVIAGRADVALQDVPTVIQFVREHAEKVDALWLTAPPTRVPAGFMTRRGDFELLHFFDVSIRVLQADGTLDDLDEKWQGLSDFPILQLRTGAGLTRRPL